MGSEFVITARELAKTYLLYPSPRHRLWQMLFRGRKNFYTPFEALKPLSFEIRAGETVGIVGRNGSGKSTLLQLLAGTLNPTGGTVEIKGRVAALLELGAGFNPDFSGRENVYLNGAILGMRREEIDAAFEAIAAFANIGEFIERPVATYSSGMVVRLAFSVATAARPDVLIVDEALSVGDESFQRKCFARIERMRQEGTTVLFVSHAAQTVIQLCDRALWLDRGELLMDGDPKAVIDRYHHYLHAPPEQREALRHGNGAQEGSQYRPQGGRISQPELLDEKDQPVTTLTYGRSYRLRYRVDLECDVADLRCGMLLKTRTGVEVAGAVLHLKEQGRPRCKAGEPLTVTFRFRCLLYPRSYFLNCGIFGEVDGEERYLHRLIDAAEIRVLNPSGRNAHGVSPEGLVDLDFSAALDE